LSVPGWQVIDVGSQQVTLQGLWLPSPQTSSHRFVFRLQAVATGHSSAPVQPHTPARQLAPSALDPQSMQAPPARPQALELPPASQRSVAMLQQPPLQAIPAPHCDWQVCVVGSQAIIDGQSVAAEQPQAPPRHALPCDDIEQFAHVPDGPQAFGAEPGWHVLPSQHPPAQPLCEASPQAASQVWRTRLHDSPDGQSPAAPQPQVQLFVPVGSTHAWPAADAVQGLQVPDPPHADGWSPTVHVPPEQQAPPWQTPSPGWPQVPVHDPFVHVGCRPPQAAHTP
jgi:hypothetical protein